MEERAKQYWSKWAMDITCESSIVLFSLHFCIDIKTKAGNLKTIMLFKSFLHIYSFLHIEEENIVEKGEIAQNEQFHFFPQCFLCSPYLKNPLIATIHLSSAAFLNLGRSLNGVIGNELNLYRRSSTPCFTLETTKFILHTI